MTRAAYLRLLVWPRSQASSVLNQIHEDRAVSKESDSIADFQVLSRRLMAVEVTPKGEYTEEDQKIVLQPSSERESGNTHPTCTSAPVHQKSEIE